MTANLHTVGILGDSRTRSSGDSHSSPTGQGDFLSGTSPTAPYINTGNYAWAERGIANKYPYVNLSVQGKTAIAYTVALLPKELALLDKIPPTHFLIAAGINDLMTGATGAQTVTRVQNIITMLKARYSGCKCTVTTLPPVTNSTDNWATLANQSLSGTLPNGTTPTWSNFTDNTHTTGRSLYNFKVRNAQITGADNFIEASTPSEDGGDERYWYTNSSTASYTNDGIHPNQAMHTLIAANFNPDTLFG